MTAQRVSPLFSREARFQLLRRMKALGLRVRMHAFEYLIARRKFACILLLEPAWSKAHLFTMKWNQKEAHEVSSLIAGIIVEADPSMEIEMK